MIELEGVTKSFPPDREVIRDVNLEVGKEDWVWIVGATGVGKSVLLKMIFGEITPTSGKIRVFGEEVCALGEKKLSALRRRMGMVFQKVRLLEERTVFQNVYLILKALGVSSDAAEERSVKWLDEVGMRDSLSRCPYQLSIGQRQKIALARALAKEPELLVLDEPFSALDEREKGRMLKLLGRMNQKGVTILAASHEHQVLHFLPGRVLHMDEEGIT